MPPRTVALVAAVCVTIGWLLAATLTPPVARLQSLAERQQRPQAATEQPAFTERLNLGMREAPSPPTTKRNPFNFGSRVRNVTPVAESEPTRLDAAPVAAAPGQPTLVYSLSGIGIAGDVRTAVLTDGQDVRIVKVNDAIAGYTVVEITDSSVTLSGETARHTLRLAQ